MATRYIKLGPKAEIFYDPTTRTKVLKGQVVPLQGKNRFSKKITAALAGQHLVAATKDEFESYSEELATTNPEAAKKATKVMEDPNAWIEKWLEDNELEHAVLMKLSKDKLIALAQHFESENTAEELGTLSKAELTEEIIEIGTEEEEEDED